MDHRIGFQESPWLSNTSLCRSITKNIVVALNTGAGKTLIASMILAKMCKLNPNRMGLMLVDRVPLGFQQGDATAEDTNLSVMSLCGENKTKK